MVNDWQVIFKVILTLRGGAGITCKVYTAHHVFAGVPQEVDMNAVHICLKEGAIEHYVQLDAIVAVTVIPQDET